MDLSDLTTADLAHELTAARATLAEIELAYDGERAEWRSRPIDSRENALEVYEAWWVETKDAIDALEREIAKRSEVQPCAA